MLSTIHTLEQRLNEMGIPSNEFPLYFAARYVVENANEEEILGLLEDGEVHLPLTFIADVVWEKESTELKQNIIKSLLDIENMEEALKKLESGEKIPIITEGLHLETGDLRKSEKKKLKKMFVEQLKNSREELGRLEATLLQKSSLNLVNVKRFYEEVDTIVRQLLLLYQRRMEIQVEALKPSNYSKTSVAEPLSD